MLNRYKNIKRQRGVVAIEFSIGFIALFLFTMLIFETARVTYINSVLDYATAEAARDSRVQQEENTNKDYNYKDKNCSVDYEGDPLKIAECERIQKMAGKQQAIWFYDFIKDNAGPLWAVFTSESDYELAVTLYRDAKDYAVKTIYKGDKPWDEAMLAEYEVTYTYRPTIFPASFAEAEITRRLLIIQDTALYRKKLETL